MTLISYNLNITNTYSNGALYDASTNKYTSGENQNEGINEWGIENDSSFNQLLKFNDLTKNYKIKFKAKVLSEGTVVDINFKLVKSSIVEPSYRTNTISINTTTLEDYEIIIPFLNENTYSSVFLYLLTANSDVIIQNIVIYADINLIFLTNTSLINDYDTQFYLSYAIPYMKNIPFNIDNLNNVIILRSNYYDKIIQEIKDKVYIDFENYDIGPISDSSNNNIQYNWSGGSQPYFTNDSTDAETITNTYFLNPGSKSWFFRQLYGNPGSGSPHTKRLQIEQNAANEEIFNMNLRGKTYTAAFWFYSSSTNATVATNDTLKVYNGTFQGNDRTGFNINITNTYEGIKISTYTFAYNTQDDTYTYPEFILDDTLSYDKWHLVKVKIKYDINGNPNNDVFTYKINTGNEISVPSWPNLYRLHNNYQLVYGTRLAFATTNYSATGWHIGRIYYYIN